MAASAVARVATLQELSSAAANQIIAAAKSGGTQEALEESQLAQAPGGVHPGVERWPVKTGTDADAALVGQNVLNGKSLGEGVVPATVEDLIQFKRASDMPPLKKQFPTNSFYQNKRTHPAEVTIWELSATIKEARLESDGDYHLVLVGASGQTLIGEIPDPDPTFVKNPEWMAVIKLARAAFDQTAGPLQAKGFDAAKMAPPTSDRFAAARETEKAAAMTPVNRRARLRGIGFFDSDHGQTGVAPNAIELHPILQLEFL